MLVFLIIDSVMCVGIFLAAFGLQMGAGYASERNRNGFGAFLSMFTLALFATVVISVTGAWASHLLGNDGLALVFAALPWVHLLLVIGAMALAYRRK